MFGTTTYNPTVVKNPGYVIVGSVDHGFEVPPAGVMEIATSLADATALLMEVPLEFHRYLSPMSTEMLAKASVMKAPVEYLSGNSLEEDIGEYVLKYAPLEIAEVSVPCISMRNSHQIGVTATGKSIAEFTAINKARFGFLDIMRTLENYNKILEYWEKNGLDYEDLDHFSYDFEKFVGDIREFELWQPEIKDFRGRHQGKVAVCVGDYHVPFVRSVLDGEEPSAPEWKNHIDNRRQDVCTPQDADFLKGIYANIEKALIF